MVTQTSKSRTIVFNEEVIRVKAYNGCEGCCFSYMCNAQRKDSPKCFASERSDKTSIIYKRLWE